MKPDAGPSRARVRGMSDLGGTLDSGFFIALLNPGISAVLGAAMVLVWLYQRHKSYLLVLAGAFFATAVGFLLQQVTLPFGFALTRLLSILCFSASVIGAVVAVLSRYGRPVPYVPILGLAGLGLAGFCWFMFVDPNLTWRIFVFNVMLGAICLVVAAELRAVPARQTVDNVLLALALLSALNFLVRPVVLVALEGPYRSLDTFHTSLYWTTTVLSHALMALLIALCLLGAAVLDMLGALRSESHTDQLSGLLNRRGFESAAAQLLVRARRQRMPATLVVADLDHFKAVNDNFGHAAGDRVIVAFAELLRQAAGRRGLAARLGGEEFAVLLPATDLAAARLFAEGMRTAFATGIIADVPERLRTTASFGVASLSGDEALDSLMRRADEALYRAKASGRDGVRMSYERAPQPPRPGSALPF